MHKVTLPISNVKRKKILVEQLNTNWRYIHVQLQTIQFINTKSKMIGSKLARTLKPTLPSKVKSLLKMDKLSHMCIILHTALRKTKLQHLIY